MTKDEFEERVATLGFPRRVYLLDGKYPRDCYLDRILDNNPYGWRVFMVERGEMMRDSEKWFKSESEQLEYLLNDLIRWRLILDKKINTKESL
jgi:hypothetical protein